MSLLKYFLGPRWSHSCLDTTSANQNLGHFCIPLHVLLDQKCSTVVPGISGGLVLGPLWRPKSTGMLKCLTQNGSTAGPPYLCSASSNSMNQGLNLICSRLNLRLPNPCIWWADCISSQPTPKQQDSSGSILLSLFLLTPNKADYVAAANPIFSIFLFLIHYYLSCKSVLSLSHFVVLWMETVCFIKC